MRIAIVSINYHPEMTGIAVYSTGMAEHLARIGNEVDCYTAFPYYPQWRKAAEDRRALFRHAHVAGVSVRRHFIHVPARPSALGRIVMELSFVVSATLGYLAGPRADCTVIVSPALFLGIPIALAAKLKGSRTIFHVQDLQPDAAVELGMLRQGRLTDFFYWVERTTYRLVDRVSSISRGMVERIAAKGVPRDKLMLFRNWANDDVIVPLPRWTRFRRLWSLRERFVVLYSGNMGVKQGLCVLLDCAERLRACRDIVFLIVGEGGEKAELAASATARGLDNVLFQPLQPLRHLGRVLATADVSVIPQQRGITDIVMPSKLANIMASARPVIAAASADSELGRIVTDAGCGVLVAPGDAAALAAAILELRADAGRCERYGSNGRAYMEQHLSSRAVLEHFARELRALVPHRRSGAAAYPEGI